jgi:hypothetical protein
MSIIKKCPAFTTLLRNCASANRNDAINSQNEFAQIIASAFSFEEESAEADLNVPLRSGVLVGDNVRSLYTQVPLGPGEYFLEYPLDILAPGEEGEYIAYTQPGTGTVAERHIEGDYVRVPTFKLQNALDWDLKFMEQANYPVMSRILEIYQAGYVVKINNDGWSTIISAAADRNVMVYDADASAGQFTKRLVSLGKIVMRRNGGGNATSMKRAKLTDIFGSPEMGEDIRNWGIDQLDDISRNRIYTASDGSGELTRIFDVNIHELDEFGENQVYQQFFTEQLGGAVETSDVELAIGIDMLNRDSFVMPVKQEVQVFNDESQHRRKRAGIYGWCEVGFGVLDSRRVIALSF